MCYAHFIVWNACVEFAKDPTNELYYLGNEVNIRAANFGLRTKTNVEKPGGGYESYEQVIYKCCPLIMNIKNNAKLKDVPAIGKA